MDVVKNAPSPAEGELSTRLDQGPSMPSDVMDGVRNFRVRTSSMDSYKLFEKIRNRAFGTVANPSQVPISMDVVKNTSPAEGELSTRLDQGPSMPSGIMDGARNFKIKTSSMDSYKLLEKIGNGAFGTVWRARHRRTGDDFAIKSLHVGSGKTLLREASLLSLCRGNPFVVGLRGMARCSKTDKLHLVMDLFGPTNLHDVLIARGHPLSELEVRSTMRQLLAGVEMMHAQGVVHCDLKPGNILVGKDDGRLKICDLGLARSNDVPLRDPRKLQGTPGYMAPEALLGEDCSAAVDMWSLGCVMAELVTARPLFQVFGKDQPGKAVDNFQQAIEIIHLLGVPDDVSALPLYVLTPSKLRQKVPEEQLPQAGFDVLRGLLEYHPKDRLSAAAALQMPWFAAKDEGDAASLVGLS